MNYGELPKSLGLHQIDVNEMMFYQYLPIKFPEKTDIIYEERLRCFDKIIGIICCDYIGEYGLDRYVNSYVYLTAKNMYQNNNCLYNRPNWHSDGFLTDDINYIWSNKLPTTFNGSTFNLCHDDSQSLIQMEAQALPINDKFYSKNELLRLNQYCIHKVSDIKEGCIRAFLKISFSLDKYDLVGNSHNYLLDYNWQMRNREISRNMPQNKSIYGL